jgi:hypothetical protein
VGRAGANVLRVNVDDVAANGAGRVEHEGNVFGDLDGVLGFFVDSALVDGVGHGRVDQLAQDNALLARLEEAALPADGQNVLEFGVIRQLLVDPVGERHTLLVRVRVHRARG